MDHVCSFPCNHLATALAFIEERLEDRLTLAQIAASVDLSPYHFSRLFTAHMGKSPMAYARERRLLRAARRIADEPRLRLVDLAFDCQFDSQEAFTRAFKRFLGVPPGRFRHTIHELHQRGELPMTPAADTDIRVFQLPDLVDLAPFYVAGLSRRFDETTSATIPELWQQLVPRLPLKGQVPSFSTYGVVDSVDRSEGSFEYLAGVAVESKTALPQGFTEITISASTFAVFRIVLDGGPPHPQVKAAMTKIWGELVPASGLELAEGPDFELYESSLSPERPNAEIDFYIPVRR